MCASVCEPCDSGPLLIVFQHFEPKGSGVAILIAEYARALIVTLDCQVWYFLSDLEDFPHKWVQAVDPRRSIAERNAIYDEGWKQRICCKDPNVCRKLPFIYSTLEELRACPCSRSVVKGYARHGKTNNMNVERVLNLVKKSTPTRLLYAERVCAAGCLQQWLSPHILSGGLGPPNHNSCAAAGSRRATEL